MLPAPLTQPRGKGQECGGWSEHEEGMGPTQEEGSPVFEVIRSGKHARVAAGLRPGPF